MKRLDYGTVNGKVCLERVGQGTRNSLTYLKENCNWIRTK